MKTFNLFLSFKNFNLSPKNIGLMKLVGKQHNTNHDLKKTIKFVWNEKFICFIYDEVISMDNASCASVYGYVVQDWCWIPSLNVQQMFFKLAYDSLTLLIMNSLMTQGVMFERRGVCFKVGLFWCWLG